VCPFGYRGGGAAFSRWPLEGPALRTCGWNG